jgi:hypothetical protein
MSKLTFSFSIFAIVLGVLAMLLSFFEMHELALFLAAIGFLISVIGSLHSSQKLINNKYSDEKF